MRWGKKVKGCADVDVGSGVESISVRGFVVNVRAKNPGVCSSCGYGVERVHISETVVTPKFSTRL